ncbi:MAG: histidinol-phosphate transaminase [Schumannella sp.]
MVVTLRPEIAALQPYRQGRPAAADAFKLSSNESPFPPLPAVLEAVAASHLNRYPDAAATILRTRLAERVGVEPDEVHVGSGSVAILQQLIQAAAGPGDEVLYAWRSFEAYPGLVTVSGATSVTVPLREDATHDLQAMADAITERTRVVIVCSPNNPTSTVVTTAEFEAFMARVPQTLLVLLDEAYAEFVTDPDAVHGLADGGRAMIERYPNLVVLRTFSKAYGLAGLRVGWAVGPAAILNAARSTAIPLSPSPPRARRSPLSTTRTSFMQRVAVLVERREEIERALAEQGWRIPPRRATSSGFPPSSRPPRRARRWRPAGSSPGCSRRTASGCRWASRNLWKNSYGSPPGLCRPSERRPESPG